MIFREDRATQAAGILLSRESSRVGSEVPRMNYLKLLKLLYMAERLSLVEATKSITGDRLVGTSQGLLLSETFDLIKASEGGSDAGYWGRHIQTQGYDVVARDCAAMEVEDLSDADERRLNQIYDQFGHLEEQEIAHWMQENLDELTDPKGSSRCIPTRDIFFAADLTDHVVAKKESELYQLAQFERVLGL